MSAGGEVWSQSSRFKLFGGDFPATFHVATKILCQNTYIHTYIQRYAYLIRKQLKSDLKRKTHR